MSPHRITRLTALWNQHTQPPRLAEPIKQHLRIDPACNAHRLGHATTSIRIAEELESGGDGLPLRRRHHRDLLLVHRSINAARHSASYHLATQPQIFVTVSPGHAHQARNYKASLVRRTVCPEGCHTKVAPLWRTVQRRPRTISSRSIGEANVQTSSTLETRSRSASLSGGLIERRHCRRHVARSHDMLSPDSRQDKVGVVSKQDERNYEIVPADVAIEVWRRDVQGDGVCACSSCCYLFSAGKRAAGFTEYKHE